MGGDVLWVGRSCRWGCLVGGGRGEVLLVGRSYGWEGLVGGDGL